MAIGPRIDLRQSQTLLMTPQLRQAIKLLQFSNLEVAAFVEQELERNPLLERSTPSDDAPPRELAAPDQRVLTREGGDSADQMRGDSLPSEAAAPLDVDYSNSYDPGGAADGGPLDYGRGRSGEYSGDGDDGAVEQSPTLRDRLSEQLRLGFEDPVDRLIGAYLIALLCPAGRLTAEPQAIADALGVPLGQVEMVRAHMMRFDPVGLFARSLKECLAAQLAERNRLDPAMATMLDNLDLLARRDLRQLSILCGVDAEDIADMVAELKRLDPKPGAGFDDAAVVTRVPDVLMRRAPDGGYLLELNPETMPRVLVNQSFHAHVLAHSGRTDRTFVAEQMQSASWLVKALAQRAQTILRVAAEIVRRQDAFFTHGISQLRPLILRTVAEEVELHESTVSRVTANKYIATPRGVFELKFFFTQSIGGTDGEAHSAESVRHRIRALVDAEASDDILSDDAIVRMLREEGVDIARRTVAKYRDALHIPSSVQRKRDKALSA